MFPSSYNNKCHMQCYIIAQYDRKYGMEYHFSVSLEHNYKVVITMS